MIFRAVSLRLMILGLLAGAVGPGSRSATASEVCHFAGDTDYSGHVEVTTNVAVADTVTTVDVVVTFDAITMFVIPIRYLVEEVSRWRAGVLDSVAANTRYLVGGQIVRQQWDVFQRGPEGLQAYRVQAKTLDDFRRRHPGFVQHWDPATFGQPWLQDYQSARPERRADLDLKASPLPPNLRPPLAMAFYWIRWLPRGGQDVPIFLPGFKADRLMQLPITGASVAGGVTWRAPLHHPALSGSPISVATALTSFDGELRQVAFAVHGPQGSAQGRIDQQGCQGTPIRPS